MRLRPLARLVRDCEGVTVVEFAMIAPALMVVMMGLLDLSHNMYTAEMLQGAIQKAARDSTIESAAGKAAVLDATVTKAVRAVSGSAKLKFSRKAYANFAGVNRPEDYTDLNLNDACDAGEPFEDANGNGSWDLDPGEAGFGAARDAVLYEVTVDYQRPFPIAAFIPGQSETFTLVATTVLRNQPYVAVASGAPAIGNCA